jgi:5-methylcytosine-specific restriction endonuclease McrA
MARNYKSEYEKYQGTPEQIRNRAKRNKARRELMQDGRVAKGDGMDVDHKTPLSKGGSTSKTNLRVRSKSANRSFSRTSSGAIKKG